MCTKAYWIIQEERALGMHNLRFVPKFRDFFSCCPAKYARLHVQQVETREKQFPFVKFAAKYKALLVSLWLIEFTCTVSAMNNVISLTTWQLPPTCTP